MKRVIPKFWLQGIHWSLGCCLAGLVVGCSPENAPIGPSSLNSRYTEEQPAISGNGRYLAFVSHRNGVQQLLLYDLEQQRFIPLPRLNRRETIAESPSLSYTGRYIAYITSDQGRPIVALYDRVVQQSQYLTQFYLGWVRHPSISPDGRYVVFESTSRGQWDVEVLDRGPNVELDIPDGTRIGGTR